MSRNLDGVVAIVTGASRGLGRAFARDLVERGACVTIVARSAEGLAETAALVDRGREAFEIVVGDVTDPATAAHAVERTEDSFGPVDVLINNAGTMLVGFWRGGVAAPRIGRGDEPRRLARGLRGQRPRSCSSS